MGQKSADCNGADACIEVEDTSDGLIKITAYQGDDEPRRAIYATKGEFRSFLAGAKKGEFDGIAQGSAEGAPLDKLPETVTTGA